MASGSEVIGDAMAVSKWCHDDSAGDHNAAVTAQQSRISMIRRRVGIIPPALAANGHREALETSRGLASVFLVSELRAGWLEVTAKGELIG
jgi:hypothetical protein